MITPFVNTNGEGGGLGDLFWMLLPLLCCLLMMSSRGGGESRSESVTVTESWYTTLGIEKTYEEIERETAEWRRQAEERARRRADSFTSRLTGIFRRGQDEERFVVKETKPPRLYRMVDTSGPIFFELTEVEGGGTVVKATYPSSVKSRMARFKARLPLKIPAAPIGDRCPSCGKPVLPEFILCPYCGEKLIKRSEAK